MTVVAGGRRRVWRRLVVLTFATLSAWTANAHAADIQGLQQRLQGLSAQMMQCPDDACRARVQREVTDLISQLNRAVGEQRAGPIPSRMALPEAGTIAPNAESWRLEVRTDWTSQAPGAIARSHLAGEISLRADARGVFTGRGTLEAEVVHTTPPGCTSDPLRGHAEVAFGGLRDGDFIWFWIVPGEPIHAVGEMRCQVPGRTLASRSEVSIEPAQELLLEMPALLRRREGVERVTTGNAQPGAGGGPHGHWRRLLRLTHGRNLRDRLPPPPAENDWLLEYRLEQGNYRHSGKVVFAVLEDSGRVRGVGPLQGDGPDASFKGRLILDGIADDNGMLSFVPRAVMDDVTGHGVEQHGLGQMFFNVLFHAGDQKVRLPMRDGAELRQGPVTWRLHGRNPCRLTITSPKQDARFRYDAAAQGRLSLRFAAKMKPARLANKIKWTLPSLGAGKVDLTPKNATGPRLAAKLLGLPKSNRDFGAKTVKASVRARGCNVAAARTVRLFYTRDAKNHPGGNEPNWFYYWSQTGAHVGAKPHYGARQGHCAQPAVKNAPETLGYYASKRSGALPGFYVICDLTLLGAEMKFDALIWNLKKIVVAGAPSLSITAKTQPLTGIDTFGLACVHENEHMSNAHKWWKRADGSLIVRFARRNLDTDSDDIPDKVERALNAKWYGATVLEVGKQRTNQNLIDEEFYTQLSHTRWKVGSADREDWAYPGKQWPK